jgi:hypothetical protein
MDINDVDLRSDFTIHGHWWDPTSPKCRVSGQLQRQAGAVQLTLHGNLRPLPSVIRATQEPQRYEVLHGLSSDGDLLTLLGCIQTNFRLAFGSGRAVSETVYVGCAVLGAHLLTQPTFAKMTFRIPGLAAWLGMSGINHRVSLTESTVQTTLDFGEQPQRRVAIPAEDMELLLGTSLRSSINPFGASVLTVGATAAFIPSSRHELSWYFERYEALLFVLTVLAGEPMPADAIHAKVEESGGDVAIVLSHWQGTPCSKSRPQEFFLTAGSVGTTLDGVLQGWFASVAAIRETSRLAQSIFATPQMWLHVEFLSLMQALEGFHRALAPGTYLPDDQYEPIAAALVNAIPASVGAAHRDALRSRIRYGNQISLSRRLSELADRLDDKLRPLVLGRNGRIPRSWVATRNYYTHWDVALLADRLESRAMVLANRRMRLFLRCLYLREMGVPTEAVLAGLRGTSDFAQDALYLTLLESASDSQQSEAGVIMRIHEASADDAEHRVDTPRDG